MEEIHTKRLLLRSVTISDASFLLGLWNSEDWLKYIGDRNIKTIDQAEAIIKDKYFASYRDNGFGSFLVIEKVSGTPIGACGLYQRDMLKHPDIGFAFLPTYYRKGYGYESANAVMEFATTTLKLKTIYGITLPINTPSIQLLQKIGLHEISTYTDEKETTFLLFST